MTTQREQDRLDQYAILHCQTLVHTGIGGKYYRVLVALWVWTYWRDWARLIAPEWD